ncbi:unnamed protein product [Linum trigynum]|uniref:Secreted protein n=1 Tax=Linum trigynum TaxID=586398 RepID=A0AAV2EYH2_9ROSI
MCMAIGSGMRCFGGCFLLILPFGFGGYPNQSLAHNDAQRMGGDDLSGAVVVLAVVAEVQRGTLAARVRERLFLVLALGPDPIGLSGLPLGLIVWAFSFHFCMTNTMVPP